MISYIRSHSYCMLSRSENSVAYEDHVAQSLCDSKGKVLGAWSKQ